MQVIYLHIHTYIYSLCGIGANVIFNVIFKRQAFVKSLTYNRGMRGANCQRILVIIFKHLNVNRNANSKNGMAKSEKRNP